MGIRAVFSMAYITCCVSGADLKHKTFDLHGHFFFSFFERWQKYFKNISSKVCRYKISSYICRVMTQKKFKNNEKWKRQNLN